MHISVVIPVYGCKECLSELYRRLKLSLEKITQNYEIVMVDDGSPDNAWDIIKELANQDNKVKGICLSRNFGQHYAITSGIDHAKGEWVVVMDGDLQDQPEVIEKLYRKAQEGFDIVFARRQERQDNFLKKLGSKSFYKLLSYLTDTKQDASIANFGIYHKKVIKSFTNMRENLRYFPVMVRWVGFRSIAISVTHAKREIGKTSYSFKKKLNLAIDVMLAYSDKPLKLTVKTGFIISFFSFLFAIYIILKQILYGVPVIGWASLMVSIWFLSGQIILVLGIVGIYLGKTFDEIKKRPLYVIREILND